MSDHAQASALMILGTASHVGKSLITAGFCRLLAEDGYRVAPFKAQNMALNSFVTLEGAEIGRAQVAQAEAAGIEPHADMNPILLKPMGGASQVIVDGTPIGVMTARDYYAEKDRLWPRVSAAYDRLASRYDQIVLEGAGSPVEVNLMAEDLVNLRMAHHADAAIVLVADIERGGVFAQIVGTWELLADRDRKRVVGFIINKFRGDVTLLDSGLDFIRDRTGVPVLGVLPFRPDLQIDQEDSLGLDETASESGPDAIDVAIARFPGLSNATDFWSLSRVPGVSVRYVDRGDRLGRPDLIILPGSKTTIRDLDWLRSVGLADRITELAELPDGPLILGICGGFQMLGERIDDPLGVESSRQSSQGLGLIAAKTRFSAEKARHRASGVTLDGKIPLVGYEIHMGETRLEPGATAFARLIRSADGSLVIDGAVSTSLRVFGTYLHGLFDSLSYTASLVNFLRHRRGLAPNDPSATEDRQSFLASRYAGLATLLRDHLDLGPIRSALGARTVSR